MVYLVNEIRAMRIAEVIQDFRTLQTRISQLPTTPPQDDYFARGFVLLRQCISEGAAILRRVFNPVPADHNGDPELLKQHLQ